MQEENLVSSLFFFPPPFSPALDPHEILWW